MDVGTVKLVEREVIQQVVRKKDPNDVEYESKEDDQSQLYNTNRSSEGFKTN